MQNKIVMSLKKPNYFKILVLFAIFSAEPINLLGGDGPAVSSSYSVNCSLKAKPVDENVYSGRAFDWEKESKSWTAGLLPGRKNVLPLMFYETWAEEVESASKSVKDEYYELYEGKKIMIINPSVQKMAVKLVFSLGAYKKDKDIFININNNYLPKITVTRNGLDFNDFIIDDIILRPGKNEIIFSSKKITKTGQRNLFSFLKKNKKKLFIRLKSIEPSVVSYFSSRPEDTSEGKKSDTGNPSSAGLDQEQFHLLSRSLNVDLSEYPYLDFYCEFGSFMPNIFGIFLGIDSNADQEVDYYIGSGNLENINLFDLASKKEQQSQGYSAGFTVKKVFIFSDAASPIDIKGLVFYSKKGIIVPAMDNSISDFMVTKINGKQPSVSTQNGILVAKFDKLANKNEFIELSFPMAAIDEKGLKNHYLSFSYKVEYPEVQKIHPFLGFELNKNSSEISRKVPLKDMKISDSITPEGFKKDEFYLGDINKEPVWLILQLEAGQYTMDIEDASFFIKDIQIYKKYPATMKDKALQDDFLHTIKNRKIPLFSIGQKNFYFSQITNKYKALFEDGIAYFGSFKFKKGKHDINIANNSIFDVEWARLGAKSKAAEAIISKVEPDIAFLKINQAKYIIDVKNAKNAFWLTFLEAYHPQWKLYAGIQDQGSIATVGSRLKFGLTDFKYIFKKPIAMDGYHFHTNLYSNSWYIDPNKLDLPEDFTIILFFLPQAYFYLGLIVSAFIALFCILWLVVSRMIRGKRIRDVKD